MLKALIFDVDGTLADTEMAHLAAFNHAFAELGMDWHWDVPTYTKLLEVSGGKERIRHFWDQQANRPQALDALSLDQHIAHIHELKTAAYEKAVLKGNVNLRPGVLNVLNEAEAAGMRMAIATTTSPVNIAALLRQALGPDWAMRFQVIEDASTAVRKKPDPLVYHQTLARMGLPAQDCLAIEDSANGLRAARAAGLPTLITLNEFTAQHHFDGALRVLPSLQGVNLRDLQQWHQEATH
jgi:HAD superfamily hydrolase (TIGR01509 family)